MAVAVQGLPAGSKLQWTRVWMKQNRLGLNAACANSELNFFAKLQYEQAFSVSQMLHWF